MSVGAPEWSSLEDSDGDKIREPVRRLLLSKHHMRLYMGAWRDRINLPPASTQDPDQWVKLCGDEEFTKPRMSFWEVNLQ